MIRPFTCEVCGKPLPPLYCTENVCQECCEAGLCPCDSWCKAPRDRLGQNPVTGCNGLRASAQRP